MITLALSIAATGTQRPPALDAAQYPRPVAMGMCQWDAGGVFAEQRVFIRQEIGMSTSAERLHGFLDREAKSKGIKEPTAVAGMTNALVCCSRIVGWDLDFDLDVIRAALIRFGKDPANLIRPQLLTTSLAPICATICGQQNEDGEAVAPTISEAVKAIAPDAEIDTSNPLGRAAACRVIYTVLCAEGLIEDFQEAA